MSLCGKKQLKLSQILFKAQNFFKKYSQQVKKEYICHSNPLEI